MKMTPNSPFFEGKKSDDFAGDRDFVKTFFEKQGFKLESVLPMPFDAYYISMLSEKYKGGYVNYGRAMVHGYFSNTGAAKKGNTYSSQVYILRPVK